MRPRDIVSTSKIYSILAGPFDFYGSGWQGTIGISSLAPHTTNGLQEILNKRGNAIGLLYTITITHYWNQKFVHVAAHQVKLPSQVISIIPSSSRPASSPDVSTDPEDRACIKKIEKITNDALLAYEIYSINTIGSVRGLAKKEWAPSFLGRTTKSD